MSTDALGGGVDVRLVVRQLGGVVVELRPLGRVDRDRLERFTDMRMLPVYVYDDGADTTQHRNDR